MTHALSRRPRRAWYTGPVLALKSTLSIFLALKEHRLSALIPAAAVLVAVAIVLYFVSLVSPLAPFVYSLF